MAFCPNFSLPGVQEEFNELTDLFGDSLAYYLWDKNGGYPLDKAPNGKESNLFKDILKLPHIRKDRRLALKFKANAYKNNFKTWFQDGIVDENGEPKLLYKLSENDFEYTKGDETIAYTGIGDKFNNFGVVTPVFSNSSEGYDLTEGSVVIPSNSIKALFNDGSFDVNDDNIFYNKKKVTIKKDYSYEEVRPLIGLDIKKLLQAIDIPSNIQPFLYRVQFASAVFNDSNVLGMYLSSENKILLSKDATQNTIYHEIVHAATVHAMFPENRGKLSEEQKQAVDIIQKIWKDNLLKRDTLNNLIFEPYGLTDAAEMVAEYLSNEKFRDYLNEINKKEKLGFLSELILAIKRLFNIKTNNDITDLLSNIDILIEATEKLSLINNNSNKKKEFKSKSTKQRQKDIAYKKKVYETPIRKKEEVIFYNNRRGYYIHKHNGLINKEGNLIEYTREKAITKVKELNSTQNKYSFRFIYSKNNRYVIRAIDEKATKKANEETQSDAFKNKNTISNKDNSIIEERIRRDSTLYQTDEIKVKPEITKDDTKELHDATSELEKSILSFLSNNKVLFRKVKQLYDAEEKNPLNKEVTGLYAANAIRNGKEIKHLIELLEGETSISELSEETAHFVTTLLRGTPIYETMMNRITDFSIYQEVKDSYEDAYDKDETAIKEEAIGQLISQIIVRQETPERQGLMSLFNRFWDAALKYLKSIFTGVNIKGEKGFNNIVSPFINVAESILNGDIIEGTNPTEVVEMYHIDNIIREERIKLKEKIIETKEFISLNEDNAYFNSKLDKVVKNRVTDSVTVNRDKYMRSKDFTHTVDPIYMLKGTYIHQWNQEIANIFNSKLEGVKSLKEAESRLMNYVDNLLKSNNENELYKIKEIVDKNSAEGLKKQLGRHSLSDIQDIAPKHMKELILGMFSTYNNIYLKADFINKKSGGDFAKGDIPIIISEAIIYNELSDTAGTIDLLVIQPNNTIDKYDYKTKQFKVDYKTKKPRNPFNAISKEGHDIQLLNYNTLLVEGYGINPKNLGESRIIPINVAYNYDKKTNQFIAKGFKSVEAVYMTTKKEYLKPIPTQAEKHYDKQFNKSMELFFSNRENLLVRLKKATKKDEKLILERELDRVETLLTRVLIDNDLHYIYRELSTINNTLSKRINIPQGDKGALSISVLNSYLEYLSNYEQIYTNSLDLMNNLTKNQQDDYKKIPGLINQIQKRLITKSIELINAFSEEDIDITDVGEEISAMAKSTMQLHEFNQPYMKRFNELVSYAENSKLNKIKELIEDIQIKDDNLNSWAKKNGISKSKAFDYLYNHKSGHLIGKFSKEHFEKFQQARTDKDLDWLKKYTDVGSKEFNERLKEGRNKLETILREYGSSEYTEERIKEELKLFDIKYNPSVNKKAYFNPYNYYVRLKENNEGISDEWEFLNKKGNEALLDYYNTYIKYNTEFSELLGININPRYIANIRASLWEKISKDGFKGIGRLGSIVKHSLETREYDPESTKIDSKTKQQRKTIPLYMSDSIREPLTTKEYNKIKEELDNEKEFIPESLKYNSELQKRISKAEFNKGNTFKSFDLTRSLVLFGEKVYANHFYSEKEDIALGIRNVLHAQENKTEILGSQGKTILNKLKGIAMSVAGIPNGDLEVYNKFLNYYFYGEKLQNKDTLYGKGDKGRKISLNKVIRSILNFTAIKALGLNGFLALGNAINSISSVYIMAAGELNYNRKDVTSAVKGIISGDKKVHGLDLYIDPSARNLIKERANNISSHILNKYLTMDNLFILHKKPDDFTDKMIMTALSKNYGVDEQGNLVKVRNNNKIKSIFDSIEINEEGDFKIVNLDKDSKAFRKFRQLVKFESTRIKGSIPSESQNLLNTNIYVAAATQFRSWIKGTAQARLGKVHHSNTYNSIEGGRFLVAYQQLVTHSGVLDKLKLVGNLLSEIVRMGIPFGTRITNSMLNKNTVNNKAIDFYYAKYLMENKLTSNEFSKEDYVNFVLGKLRETAKEISIVLQLIGLYAFSKGMIPDDKDDPMYLVWRALHKGVARGVMELGFWVDPNSTLSILNNPIPSVRTFTNLYDVVKNTIDVSYDIAFRSDGDPYKAVFKKAQKDKTPVFYQTQKFIPGIKFLFDLMDVYDKPLTNNRR